MASIVSLTTMSGFTLAVNCPPPGSLVPSCWFFSFLFFPFRFPADWERSESADSWLRFLSHMQPDTPNQMLLYGGLHQTNICAGHGRCQLLFGELLAHTRTSIHTHAHIYICTHTHTEILLEKRASLLICACFQNLCVLCVCLNRSMDFDNYADNEF